MHEVHGQGTLTVGERTCRLCNGIPVLQSLEDAGLEISPQLNMFQCSIDLEPSELGESNSGERGEGPEVDPSEREPTMHFPKSHAQVTTREAMVVRL